MIISGDIKNLEVDEFNKKILPEFAKYLNSNSEMNATLDFRKVTFINALVMPKLCALGLLAQKQGKEKIKILFDIQTQKRVISYLWHMNFFLINEKWNIFDMDYLVIGDIQKFTIKNVLVGFSRKNVVEHYKEKFLLNGDISELDRFKYGVLDILLEGQYYPEMTAEGREVPSFAKLFKMVNERTYDENITNDLILMMTDLIVNSVYHGDDLCFVIFQTGVFNKTDYKLAIAISDIGKGLYNSLESKDWNSIKKSPKTMSLRQFKSLKSSEQQNYYSIVEAMMYRKGEGTRGIYQVLENFEKWGTSSNVRFMSQGISLSLDKFDLKKLIELEDNKATHKIFLDKYKNIENMKIQELGKGFHIDMEFDEPVRKEENNGRYI